MKDLNIIVKMKFGSHLYGTNTKDSDIDYKGVYLPSKEEIFLNKVSKSYSFSTKQTKGEGIRNTSDDIDQEIYSLHYFIKLACEGQTVALDMLHAPDTMLLQTSKIWDKIVLNKEKFYTRSLNAFVCYARKQAAKYGIKGSRLSDSKKLLDLLYMIDSEAKLTEYWGLLPDSEHLKHIQPSINGLRQYQVCGKILQESIKISKAIEIVENFYLEYGKRARLASDNQGIDWKAISHAFRAAYQVKSILINNTIVFPLPESEFLIKVKQGKLDYQTEAAPKLEQLMSECEELSLKSNLPEKVNYKFWDDFIIKVIEMEYYK